MNGIQETDTHAFDAVLVHTAEVRPNETLRYVPGLEAIIRDGYVSGQLFSEMNVSWAASAQRVSLADYAHFPRA